MIENEYFSQVGFYTLKLTLFTYLVNIQGNNKVFSICRLLEYSLNAQYQRLLRSQINIQCYEEGIREYSCVINMVLVLTLNT